MFSKIPVKWIIIFKIICNKLNTIKKETASYINIFKTLTPLKKLPKSINGQWVIKKLAKGFFNK